jgi:hypothetical protein
MAQHSNPSEVIVFSRDTALKDICMLLPITFTRKGLLDYSVSLHSRGLQAACFPVLSINAYPLQKGSAWRRHLRSIARKWIEVFEGHSSGAYGVLLRSIPIQSILKMFPVKASTPSRNVAKKKLPGQRSSPGEVPPEIPTARNRVHRTL